MIEPAQRYDVLITNSEVFFRQWFLNGLVFTLEHAERLKNKVVFFSF